MRLQVSRLEKTPTEALDAATDVLARVRDVLRAHDIAGMKESRLDLRAMWSYADPAPTLTGYQGRTAVAIESTDLEDVRQLLVDVVSAGANEIDAVEFDVRAREERAELAHRRAVEVAQRKAAVLAEAAGVRVGAVLSIEEVGEPPGAVSLAVRSPRPDEDLSPGEITVMTTVRVGFAILRD